VMAEGRRGVLGHPPLRPKHEAMEGKRRGKTSSSISFYLLLVLVAEGTRAQKVWVAGYQCLGGNMNKPRRKVRGW